MGQENMNLQYALVQFYLDKMQSRALITSLAQQVAPILQKTNLKRNLSTSDFSEPS